MGIVVKGIAVLSLLLLPDTIADIHYWSARSGIAFDGRAAGTPCSDHGLAAWAVREMSKDPDLNVLHNDSPFKDLVAYANDRVRIPEKK
jgi:hypothetical protein